MKKRLANKIVAALSDDLRKPRYRGHANRLTGHCYIASEAYYHLSTENLQVWRVRHEGDTHWFLKTQKGEIIDLTVKQFTSQPNYSSAVRCGFLTKQPSKRARTLMQKL
jgi:hypothetical protein